MSRASKSRRFQVGTTTVIPDMTPADAALIQRKLDRGRVADSMVTSFPFGCKPFPHQEPQIIKAVAPGVELDLSEPRSVQDRDLAKPDF